MSVWNTTYIAMSQVRTMAGTAMIHARVKSRRPMSAVRAKPAMGNASRSVTSSWSSGPPATASAPGDGSVVKSIPATAPCRVGGVPPASGLAVGPRRSFAHRRVLVDERRPPVAVDGDDDGQPHCRLPGRDGHDHQRDDRRVTLQLRDERAE